MSRTSRRTLLFLSPIMPQRTGNGLAMRAASMLEALARRFDVHLLVVPVGGEAAGIPEFVRQLTVKRTVLGAKDSLDTLAGLITRITDPAEHRRQRLAYPEPWTARFSGASAARHALASLDGTTIDVIHVMRLYLAPLAISLLRALPAPRPVALLDLDDDDERVHARLARLHGLRNESSQEDLNRAEAAKYAALSARVLRSFDAVFTCSEDDAMRFADRNPAVSFRTVPNSYPAPDRLPSRAVSRGESDDPLRLLFVANLSYAPNADAVEQLVTSLLPALRDRGIRAHLDIVGAGATAELDEICARAAGLSIALHGFVESVTPWYRQADIAVAPLRAGGGTRIKILEAFAYRVPVVSTSIGAEGLNAIAGTHLLCADGPAEFAEACLGLASNPALAAHLVANAAELLRTDYTPARLHARMDAIVDEFMHEGR